MLTYIDFDMTKIQTTILGLTLFMLCSCGGKNTNPAIPYDNEIESQVEGVLSAMTLEEKVGQMIEGSDSGPVRNRKLWSPSSTPTV